MRRIFIVVTLALYWGCSPKTSESESNDSQGHDHTEHHDSTNTSKSKPKSPPKSVMTNIGDNHVHVAYNSPGRRGRKIFGGLVGYGEVWVTGAHRATTINFSKDVKIADVKVEKGKYALFTIPGEQEWTIIINANWDQHLADEYDQAEDLVRLMVSPTKLTEPVEWLTFDIKEIDDNTGVVSISWGEVTVSFEINNI